MPSLTYSYLYKLQPRFDALSTSAEYVICLFQNGLF